jgi:hypothetical protein
MATFDASKVRAVTIELKERTLDLYVGILPIQTAVAAWQLNGLDPALPSPFDVRVQVEAYEALVKQNLRLTEWITTIKQAQPDDALTYPPPPETGGGTGLADGTSLADGSMTAQ